MSDTLKPCPFCSSSDMLVIEDDGIHVNPKIIAVHCKSCGARGPTTGRRIDVESKIITRSRWNRRALAQQPLSVQEGWRPIAEADKGIAYFWHAGEMRIGNSYPIWVRDADGRVYEALWSDNGKKAYWWDIEGESPVDPVEFMPHPLDPRFSVPASEGSKQ